MTEAKTRRKDGTKVDTEFSNSRLVLEDTPYMVTIARDITGRIQTAEELKSRMNELERFNKLMVGRENRMIKLKEEVNKLLKNAGLPEKYKVTTDSE